MWDSRLTDIVLHLSTEQYITSENLANKLGISVRTVRNRIKEINEILGKQDVYIESKARYGYKLTEESTAVLKDLLTSEHKQVNTLKKIPVTQDERVYVILLYLLNQDDYVKSEMLQDFLCVSRGTLTNTIRQLEQKIMVYDLWLERKPNYGIKIRGDEFNIRKCMTELLLDDVPLYISVEKVNRELRNIANLIIQCINIYKIHFSEIALERFIKDIYIQVRRIRTGHYVEPLIQKTSDEKGEESDFASDLKKKIEQEYEIILPDEEKEYIFLHLTSKRTVTDNQLNYVISSDMDNLVENMIGEIYRQLGVDFRNNLSLRMTLNQHMVPFDIRMKYNIPYANPMLHEIKENYPFGFFVAKQAQTVLEKHYNKKISEDEIGFFALLFALAWEQKEKQEKGTKLNVLIVCNSGRGIAKIIEYKFLHIFSEYLNDVYTSDLLGLDKFDFAKVDYIFTTVPIHQNISKPIQEIGAFLKDEDISVVKNILEKENKNYIKKIFNEKYFFNNIKGKNRKDILWEMCEAASQDLPELTGLFDSVMERENLCATDFGNYVAIPHPSSMLSKKTYVFIGILPQPVIWSRYPVQLVMLMLLGEMKENEQQDFYEVTTRLILNKNSIDKIIEEKDYYTFIKELEKQMNN